MEDFGDTMSNTEFEAKATLKDVQKWPFVPSPSPTLPE